RYPVWLESYPVISPSRSGRAIANTAGRADGRAAAADAPTPLSPIIFPRAVRAEPVSALAETRKRILARDRHVPIDLSWEDSRIGCAIQRYAAHAWTGIPYDHPGTGTP